MGKNALFWLLAAGGAVVLYGLLKKPAAAAATTTPATTGTDIAGAPAFTVDTTTPPTGYIINAP